MHRSTLALIAILLVLAIGLGYNYFYQPFADYTFGQAAQTEASPTPSPAVSPEMAAFNALSSEQKVAQLLLVPVEFVSKTEVGRSSSTAQSPTSATASAMVKTSSSATPSASAAFLSNRGATLSAEVQDFAAADSSTASVVSDLEPGGVILFGDELSFSDTLEAIELLKKQNKNSLLPLSIAVDHEGGRVQRLSGAGLTELPSWQEQCESELKSLRPFWRKSAAELAELGVSIVFAPMLDYAENHPVLGSRICSSDPEQVVEYGAEFFKIFQESSIQPVLKHFPGIGKAKRDLHRQFEAVEIDEVDAGVYADIVDRLATAGVFPEEVAVMISHVGVSNQFPDIPCSLSEPCINEWRGLVPEALVFSDALEMKAALHGEDGDHTLAEAARLAVMAGNDWLVFGNGVTGQELAEVKSALVAEYQSSPSFATRVDQAVRRIILFKLSQE